MALVFIVCDHYSQENADTSKLQKAVERMVQSMHEIDIDLRVWAWLPSWKSWFMRHEIDSRVNEHERKLNELAEFLSLATTLQVYDKVAFLQELLKNNPQGSANRKKAEEQLYRLRAGRPGELADLTPPELACECVRLGSQPEYSGPRNDIWKGRWLDKQDVALIFLNITDRSPEPLTQRFERQIKVWRKLDNPFVLRLYGWCKFEDETYLVSPWLRNRDVVRFLEAKKNRDRICLRLIYEIAQGLQYLHSQKIMHGSLKPSNILVQDNGSAVLSDFSLATLPTFYSSKTRSNPRVNVFRYQAPEVILDQPISEASDVYSWAMTALEIITGKPPYHTLRSAGQFVGLVITKSQTPQQTDYKSPVLDKYPELWDLFARCWQREPKERPTAKEIVDGLKRYPGLK
ncbi:hypothetical protein FRC01_005673 [Tulasnella sp. 417]|nr:hypothetical protein FRC01_005673 [Tulasnella sp. 417]